jgi:nucleoside-diphosphate-sugar epimerase
MLLVKPSAPFTRKEFAQHLDAHKIGNRMLFGGNLVRQPAFVQLRKENPGAFRVIGDLAGADRIMNESVFVGVYPGLTGIHAGVSGLNLDTITPEGFGKARTADFHHGRHGFFRRLACWKVLRGRMTSLGLASFKPVVLTRNPESFAAKMPHLAGRGDLIFLAGDVRNFSFPVRRICFRHSCRERPPARRWNRWKCLQRLLMAPGDVLEFAATRGTRKLLFVSSGAVYGRQPSGLAARSRRLMRARRLRLDPAIQPMAKANARRNFYVRCRRAKKHGMEVKIARCFAFVGPHLPLDAHFAIGNFIRDGLRGNPVQVRGDGTPYRSYLYAADLAVWLWTILFRGKSSQPYNVGSEEALTICQVADTVAAAFEPARTVIVDKKPVPGTAAQRYIPGTKRAQEELGLQKGIKLKEAIKRTILWHQKANQS